MGDDNVGFAMGWGCTVYVEGWRERGLYRVIAGEFWRLDIAFGVDGGALHVV